MSEHNRRADKRSRLIAFKASREADRDILAWWESLPEGTRSEALRVVIRAYLGSTPPVKPGTTAALPDSQTTRQIADDTAWIRAALLELPGYLERMAERVSAARPTATGGEEPASAADPTQPQLEADAIARRRDKMSRNQW